ncbi:tetratricopeptide repeat protein [Castellaniella sp. S9]|uniref:tetratricopeptide repeat protein n=1 Tax=Castellaniella sp. S9 TaxID=2993652 RepID=UPI0022B2B61F|nr:tetratricopeptide repeat protein [Castellaniella sp. S9]
MRFPVSVFPVALALFAAHGAALAAPSAATPAEPVETIHLRKGEPPAVNLTPDILFRILVAEIAAQRDMFDDAGQTLLGVARDTLDPRLARRAFQMAMAARNIPLALSAARQWAVLDPEDPEAVAASLALAASNGQTQGLAQTLARRIQHAEDRDQAIVQAAGIVSKMADKRLALDVLDKALAGVAGTSSFARLALADASWAAGDPRRALDEARRAQVLDPDSQDAAQRVLEYGLRVDPDEAVAQTQRYLQAHPDQRALHLLLVSRLTSRGQFEQALRMLADMRRRTPEDFDLLYTEAEVNARAGRYDVAVRLLNDYISVQEQRRKSIEDGASNAQSDASDARLLLVQIAERREDYKEAIRQLRLIDEPSLRFQARIHEAVLEGKLGDLARARAVIDAIRPADRRERIVRQLTLASIYRDAGRSDEAVHILRAADRDMPDSAEVKYDLAMLLERQGQTAEFETLMRRVIELDPDNANAYNSLGYTYADQGRNLDEAQGLLERALDLEPDNPYILDSVGWYLFRVGDHEAALEYLRRSYDNLPAADVAAHLGEVLWTLGRKQEARAIWAEGLREDAANETLLDTLKRFKVELPQ